MAHLWRLTVNEKNFVETALLSELRTDGRGLYDYRKLTIKFGKEYGSSEVQLGQTHVMGFVTAQLVQPYKDRPNEGSLSIFTEFSPMADPGFEPGRPGESAVELGRIIDRGLRESRAVDTESLCVLAGKLVWFVRIDLHILDNGGNLVDAANIAALAALLTFRRPECTLSGEDGQDLIIHPPEEREPLPLIIHHLPIAFTFGFFNNGNIVVMDPTYLEEAVMGGRMTVTVNTNGDICAIQKPGEEGVTQSMIFHCLRLASKMADGTTKTIKDAVEAYIHERALQKVKRHSTFAASRESEPISVAGEKTKASNVEKASELSRNDVQGLKLSSEDSFAASAQSNKEEMLGRPLEPGRANEGQETSRNFLGRPSSWEPNSKDVDVESLKASLASEAKIPAPSKKRRPEDSAAGETEHREAPEDSKLDCGLHDASVTACEASEGKTLKDAVKPKSKRKRAASIAHAT